MNERISYSQNLIAANSGVRSVKNLAFEFMANSAYLEDIAKYH